MSADRLSESETTQNSIASYDAALAELRMGEPRKRPGGHLATYATVLSSDVIRLALSDGCDDVIANITLGPADALALACDLLNAVRIRYGRPANTEHDR